MKKYLRSLFFFFLLCQAPFAFSQVKENWMEQVAAIDVTVPLITPDNISTVMSVWQPLLNNPFTQKEGIRDCTDIHKISNVAKAIVDQRWEDRFAAIPFNNFAQFCWSYNQLNEVKSVASVVNQNELLAKKTLRSLISSKKISIDEVCEGNIKQCLKRMSYKTIDNTAQLFFGPGYLEISIVAMGFQLNDHSNVMTENIVLSVGNGYVDRIECYPLNLLVHKDPKKRLSFVVRKKGTPLRCA